MFDEENSSDGVNLHEESGAEQGSEPYGGDHSAAIDNSMGNSCHRVGFLLGSCLSPPLALANSKNKTLVSCTTRRDRWVRPIRISQVPAVPRVTNCREALALQKCLIHTWLGTLPLRLIGVLV